MKDLRFDIVILDFDGTVLNSMPFLTQQATRLLVENYGLSEEEARSAYVRTTGNPFQVQMEMLFPGDPRNPKVVSEFEKAKRDNLFHFDFFPEVPEAVCLMRASGLRVCISSGNYEHLITRLLYARGLEVDLVMGYRQGFMKGRDHFEFARQHFNSDFKKMIFVGDSYHDREVARMVGVEFVARVGLWSREQLEKSLPGVEIVESLTEVLPILGIAFGGNPAS